LGHWQVVRLFLPIDLHKINFIFYGTFYLFCGIYFQIALFKHS
jgi:hypothetical protein